MGIATLQEMIPDYGRDIRLNLEAVLSPEGAPGLNASQLWSVALASAYATQCTQVVMTIAREAEAHLTPEYVEASKAAATIMGMNNVYYRFMHLAEDKEFSKMPARLRMNVIGKPGIPKADFELMCLAVSAINACGMCVNAHIHEVKKADISNEGIQSAIKIASVLNATKQAIFIG